jgi:hypothetical protein
MVAEDVECTGHTVWLTQKDKMSQPI